MVFEISVKAIPPRCTQAPFAINDKRGKEVQVQVQHLYNSYDHTPLEAKTFP
jgi:hypothetical protein